MERKRRIDLGGARAASAADVVEQMAKARVNPWTGQPYSSRYYEILKKREQLPVFLHLDQLLTEVRTHQVVVVEGETGSGKTTQVSRRGFFGLELGLACWQAFRHRISRFNARVACECNRFLNSC
jgi:pre-mRNA-splicing factor ATP-dependent RNA helicase DHX15/PRP43